MSTFCISSDGCLGDILCLISAAHTYARSTGHEVYISQLPDVVSCYSDGILRAGSAGERWHLEPYYFHRAATREEYKNYLGTFIRLLMPAAPLPVPFELPDFEKTTSRCLIQPRSVMAANPPIEFVQAIVDDFVKETGEILYAVGRLDTPRSLKNVDYSLLADDVPKLMRTIASAKCVLTPRSASAHIAAAYARLAYVWLPDDPENWHLDYQGWNRTECKFAHGEAARKDSLQRFLKKFNGAEA